MVLWTLFAYHVSVEEKGDQSYRLNLYLAAAKKTKGYILVLKKGIYWTAIGPSALQNSNQAVGLVMGNSDGRSEQLYLVN